MWNMSIHRVMEVVAVDHNYVLIDLKYVQVFMTGLQPLVKTKQLALRQACSLLLGSPSVVIYTSV